MRQEKPTAIFLFQFPPLREGRPMQAVCAQQLARHFNSRPCERGDRRERRALAWMRSISIPAPARGATFPALAAHFVDGDFNSRPCERGDYLLHVALKDFADFNSRPCERGDGADRADPPGQFRFQFPPLREGRRQHDFRSWANQLFQFPPLREGRPLVLPAWLVADLISIPAPARGATRRARQVAGVDQQFQFPPLREGRPRLRLIVSTALKISIPAPARGATLTPEEIEYCQNISIPAPARGATIWPLPVIRQQKIFQFPPLREGRRRGMADMSASLINFNSRPCERGDVWV